ncbi:GNAT family N-acetyltransferase [Bacillaceae bacterium SIJ1]|uniref:GNAT family N-acetyltransferase n=1 Tax=Litoribacterium kuwaitense TaxID=1398745 RepID=UPI0013EBC839|nr:GNAT family N-acetyltransferase [Litoribacterium kuwaitense]NGP44961.1 GNAT family N-acetyltransferase [Litoribacterium kuwaitense]
MIQIIGSKPSASIKELLSYATSSTRVNSAYRSYMSLANHHLFGYEKNAKVVGCIGFVLQSRKCEIKHIAVAPEERGEGIGSKMIEWIALKDDVDVIVAQTDQGAVRFYEACGFTSTSLGEQYPGTERFRCTLTPTKSTP